jgi:hypothetical protein
LTGFGVTGVYNRAPGDGFPGLITFRGLAGAPFPCPDIKANLIEAAKLADNDRDALTGWRWHDFRRSFASVLGVYQRSSRWSEQVRAIRLWGRLLQDAIDGKPSDANVVVMAARAS